MVRTPKPAKSKKALAFGRWLRKRRELLGFNIRLLAHRAGVGIGTLSDLEQGHVDPLEITVRTLYRLSIGYGVQITAILARLGLLPYPDKSIEQRFDTSLK